MSDRELLEAAAMAAGLTTRASTRWPSTVVRQVTLDDGSLNWVRWNPLTDDGDALRLAVKLCLWVASDGATLQTFAADGPDACSIAVMEPHNGDPGAATRRAIVRAAAQMAPSAAQQGDAP